jgi:hypothetical protein
MSVWQTITILVLGFAAAVYFGMLVERGLL